MVSMSELGKRVRRGTVLLFQALVKKPTESNDAVRELCAVFDVDWTERLGGRVRCIRIP